MLEILRNLRRRKLRSTLTISGIVIGIFALTSMGALSQHFDALLGGGVKYFSSNIQVGAPVGQQAALLPLSTMNDISKVKGVEAVVPGYQTDGAPSGGNISFGPSYQIINQDPSSNAHSSLQITVGSGHDLTATSRGEVVLGVTMAKDLGKKVGSTIALPIKPSDAPPSFVNHQFNVVGVLNKTGTAPDSFAYVSNADSRMLLADSLPKAVSSAIDINTVAQGFVVYGKSSATISELDAIAKQINKEVPSVKATPPSGPVNAFKQVNSTFSAITTGAAMLALIIGGLSVINTMIMAVSERVREIGLKKAVGAQTGQIMREYLLEATMIGAIGGVLGFLLGAVVTSLVDYVGNLDLFLVTPYLVALSIGFAVVLGAVAGVIPAFRAARMDPVTALRSV